MEGRAINKQMNKANKKQQMASDGIRVLRNSMHIHTQSRKSQEDVGTACDSQQAKQQNTTAPYRMSSGK